MKFTIDSKHKTYFQQHLAIEFSNLFDSTQLEQFRNLLLETLNKRMGDNLNPNPNELFMAGWDLWRSNEALKKIILQRRLALIATELAERKPIRIGCDEFFPYPGPEDLFSKKPDPYHQLLNKKLLLSEISSIQGVVCGLMLCLEGNGTETTGHPTAFAHSAGNGVYLSPEFVIDFQELYQRPNHAYLLIIYTQSSSVYIYQSHDPHAHAMKKLGYTFGDKLKDTLNPLIIR